MKLFLHPNKHSIKLIYFSSSVIFYIFFKLLWLDLRDICNGPDLGVTIQ